MSDMKHRIFNVAVLLAAGLFWVACSEDETASESRLSVSDFYPAVVMEGIEVTVTGTGMSDMTEVVFPGGVAATEVTIVDERTLTAIVPAGIADVEEPLTLRDADDVVQSRQMMRKAQPAFKAYQFTTAEGALMGTNMTIQGSDLLLAEELVFTLEDESLTMGPLDFTRKSDTDIKFMVPEDAPTGEGVHVKLVFENGAELALPDLEIINGNIPDDYREPVSTRAIMLNDFEVHDYHDPVACITNTWWNPADANGECAGIIKTDEWDGNSYMYYQRDLKDWTLSCACYDHGTVENIENYVIKLDVKMEDWTDYAAMQDYAIQAVIGDHWCWVGANYFPDIKGAWFTVTWNLPADFTGNYEIGTKVNGFFGGLMPTGIGIDNFRLEPK